MPQFPKPFFRASRNVWYVQIDGKQINLGADRDSAFALYHKLMAARGRGETHAAAVCGQSLVAIIDVFLEWVQKNRSPDTYEWYRYRLERLAQKYPDLRTDELKPYHVQQWVDDYDFSVTSRRNYLRTIKRCLTWAVRQGYLDRNPIAAIEVPAAEHREIVISPAEYAGLLSVVKDEHLRDLIVVTWETGCRPQESLRVEGRHVDRVNKRWVFPRSESKNKKLSRVVYLTDTAFAITQRRMAASPSGPLFRNSLGRPWTTEAVNCGFKRIRAKLGMRRLVENANDADENEIRQFMSTLKRVRTENGRLLSKTERELFGEARRKLLERKL
jgi:integrase